jgi:hypothetical protein
MGPVQSAALAVDPYSAFLNVPYDRGFKDLYLAFIAGISAFGLKPRVTLEIPGGERRLDRIYDLIRTCRYSFHDLSRVQLESRPPRTPRFNMPFELGLAVAWARESGSGTHTWFVFESVNLRMEKSLSDLRGTDCHIHEGRVDGVFRELGNALVRSEHAPSVTEMEAIYFDLRRHCGEILKRTGAKTPFEAGVFSRLAVLARASAREHIPSLKALGR